MKFKQEFKNEMDLLSPTDEQIERIKKGVFERIERDKRENPDPVNTPDLNRKPKKPLRIRIAAISGTVCAAALAVVVIGLRPSLRNDSNDFTGMNSFINGKGNPNYSADAAPGITANSFGTYHEAYDSSITDSITVNTSVGNNAADENSVQNSAEIGNSQDCDNMPGGTASDMYVNPESLGATQSTAPGSAVNSVTSSYNVPYLSFSDDMESCTVRLNGKALIYKKTEKHTGNENEHADGGFVDLQEADNDLEKKLLVHFDENGLYVFYASGELFGYYLPD